MNTAIVVCDSHTDAIEAVNTLKDNGYPTKNLSIIGKADKAKDAVIMDDKKVMNVAGTEAGVGAVLGSALGILAGVGIFAIPGLGFLYGAGALVGGIAGFDFGLIGGGLVSALTVAGIKVNETQKFDDYIKEGKFLAIAQGSEDEIHKIEKLLEHKDGIIDITTH